MLAVNPYAMKDVGYDPTTDIAPVCLAVDFSNVLVVHPSVPAKTLAEYLELAKRPEGMDYGSSGVGGAGHLAGELLKARSGAKLDDVPFRGGGPAMNDLVAGHVPSLIASAPTATPLMREGRIRALAVTGAKRSPYDPDIPTIAEQGFPGYAATNWYAVVVSSKVPPEIVAALNTILTRALKCARGAGGVCPARHGDDRQHAGRGRGPHRPRDRDLEEGHRRRRHPPGVTNIGRSGTAIGLRMADTGSSRPAR